LVAAEQRLTVLKKLLFNAHMTPTTPSFPQTRKLRVLIAEDDEQMRKLLVRLLSFDFDVVGSVANGQELVNTAVSLAPDVIVSDITMSGLTGPEAMDALHAAGHRLTFVLISASFRHVDEYIRRGAMAVVHKIDIGGELSTAIRMAAMGQTYVSRSARLF
jgi:DNA-binding NarL/FixJ family response regulator